MINNIFDFLKQKNAVQLLVVKDDNEAFKASHIIEYFDLQPYVLPDFRAFENEDLRSFKAELQSIFVTLHNYYKNPSTKKVLISPIRTILHSLPKQDLFDSFDIEFASSLDLDSLKEKLLYWGYEFVDVVQEKGEVSFRGDIVDIFPVNSQVAFRISLFDIEVENITTFNHSTQRSTKQELESITIYPAYFALDENQYNELNQKVQNIQASSFEYDIPSLGFWALDDDKKTNLLEELVSFKASPYTSTLEEFASFDVDISALDNVKNLPSSQNYKQLETTTSKLDELVAFHKNKRITLICANEIILKAHGAVVSNKDILINNVKVNVVYKDIILNLISENELIISLNKPKDIKKQKRRKATLLLDELKVNDYVVHENYGVGKFSGIEKRTVLGSTKDFLILAYQNEDKLLIPVENLDIIDRYIGEGDLPVIDKLGKSSFAKLKEKVKAKLFEIANEIVGTAASRELIKAKVIKPNATKLRAFQKDAGFEYTLDQQNSIEAVFEKFKSGKVLDMLLSGDVGFGKTEVAMNAIFACVESGYQAVFVVPTTLLSNQHYKSLHSRLSKYNIKVAKIDRFVKAKDKTQILKGLEDGTYDVCIGTHAMFGAKFKNLGFAVVDEEHKFGVKQKEKLKSIMEDLHVLSMSATPIPRSLNLALSQVKQYTQLLTPPSNRIDIRTFVKEYNDQVVKEAILREVRRGGQVFFVHNRIASIEDKKEELQELLPNLKILVLHSKVPESISDKEMINFEQKQYDILLSTSIVESGIHLPNVNTILIENANNFGIADLHQLRGRVGRDKFQGYCYFLVKNKEDLTPQSQKRLLALESNSFLGSGSVLAYHDLEIRGGGNIIGKAQSGHIKNIGYSLYLKMLEDSINELLGKQTIAKKEVDIKLMINAYISEEYISEDRIRLELYRRLSQCETKSDIYDIEEEMNERFGKPDNPTKQFLDLMIIKLLSLQKNIKLISNYAENISVEFNDGNKQYLTSRSKDDDDLIAATLEFLR
jgi:transcription-repair coupling factor (superfamily II helicase)